MIATHAPEGVHEPLTTKEGWARFVASDLRPPEPENIDPSALEDARIAYHSRLGVVRTPTVDQVVRLGRRMTLLNQQAISARRGVIVTGAAGTGKTTAITQLGKAHEMRVLAQHPHCSDRLPVLFATVPPAATARMLAVEFARFLGLPMVGRPNQADITNMVCDVLCGLHCELVIIDEIHNMNITTRAGADVADQLKYFSERLPATFVYAGIDVASTGLFAGVRGRQIASRFTTVTSAPFPYGTAAQREHWQVLIGTLESTLRLERHRAGSLVRLDRYMYERTKGMIGSLSHLIRAAAIDAILDGSERITKATLEGVQLDHAANAHDARSRRRNIR